mmetsp:Transcript_63361/g.196276  ORF Transcript_63361/g.196276 Transcript_63361/m.196276 type:complete len:235 (+) Transcript_63361:1293-1997(+)
MVVHGGALHQLCDDDRPETSLRAGLGGPVQGRAGGEEHARREDAREAAGRRRLAHLHEGPLLLLPDHPDRPLLHGLPRAAAPWRRHKDDGGEFRRRPALPCGVDLHFQFLRGQRLLHLRQALAGLQQRSGQLWYLLQDLHGERVRLATALGGLLFHGLHLGAGFHGAARDGHVEHGLGHRPGCVHGDPQALGQERARLGDRLPHAPAHALLPGVDIHGGTSRYGPLHARHDLPR